MDYLRLLRSIMSVTCFEMIWISYGIQYVFSLRVIICKMRLSRKRLTVVFTYASRTNYREKRKMHIHIAIISNTTHLPYTPGL